MNGKTWKSIWTLVAAAGVIGLWTGNAKLASLETSVDFLGQKIDLAIEDHNTRLRSLEFGSLGDMP